MTRRSDRPRGAGIGFGCGRGIRLVGCGLGLAFALASGLVQATGPEAIPWRTDLRGAEREARAQDRLLWVQFTGAWCPNCVRLEREAFVHPRIVGHARTAFVPVKLQADQHEQLVERFGLEGIPATVLITPEGQVVARHEGYVDPATFRTFLEKALVQRVAPPRQPTSLASSGSHAGRPPTPDRGESIRKIHSPRVAERLVPRRRKVVAPAEVEPTPAERLDDPRRLCSHAGAPPGPED